jgi:hypothetical protein
LEEEAGNCSPGVLASVPAQDQPAPPWFGDPGRKVLDAVTVGSIL